MYKIIKNNLDSIITTFSLIMNRGLDAVILLVITPLLIKIFGNTNYGQLTYYLTLVYIIQTFVIFGFENFIIYKTSGDESNDSKILSCIMTIKLSILFVSSIFYVVYCYSNFIDKNYYPYIFLLLPFAECFNFSHFFVAKNIASKLIFYSIIRILFYSILTICFIKDDKDINLYSIILVTSYILSIIIQNIYLTTKKKIKLSIACDKKYLISSFKESMSFFMLKVIQLLSDKLFLIIAGMWINFSSVAILDVALKIYLVIIMPFQILIISILPKIITKNITLNKNYLFMLPLFIASFLSPLSYFFTDEINLFFFHTKEVDNYYVYPIITLSAMFFIASLIISDLYLIPLNKLNVTLYSSSVVSIFIFIFIVSCKYLLGLSLTLLLLFFLIFKILDFLLKVYLLNKTTVKNQIKNYF
ncbi:hypothetical protein B5C26_07005 [Photorhabdus luminescens]|uniref:oligosaccharide flippase family protein n=1 Tax=Photorhabdus luminescens TaxID=29488 RepID=UPI000B4C28C1|nr:oligosaccharide flippase family protein [Photorhabdus luminescens]OWO83344.1 hypothetical protein B5C26_07005 [Photorhabdus luminescens]